LACSALYRKQTILFHNNKRSIPDRPVSLVQSWVWPIVRGKARARAAVEFGAVARRASACGKSMSRFRTDFHICIESAGIPTT
jgi:hypothetical protein